MTDNILRKNRNFTPRTLSAIQIIDFEYQSEFHSSFFEERFATQGVATVIHLQTAKIRITK